MATANRAGTARSPMVVVLVTCYVTIHQSVARALADSTIEAFHDDDGGCEDPGACQHWSTTGSRATLAPVDGALSASAS